MVNPEYFLENQTHKILWDFEIQTNHVIPARRPHDVIIKKKTTNGHLAGFAIPVDIRVKIKKSEKKTKKGVENGSNGGNN